MSEEAPPASPPEPSPKSPIEKPRRLLWRALYQIVRALVILGLLVGGFLGGAWLNVMPGGWRVRLEVFHFQFRRQVARFKSENQSVPAGAVVFLGASTIDKMPLAKLYPGAPALNRAIGGQDTVQMLEQIDVCLPAARPAGVIINPGANDLRAGRCEPKVVLQRTVAVVDAIRARFPGVPVAILEPIAQAPEDHDLVLQITYSSEVLQAWARDHQIPYIRVNRPPLATEDGRTREDLTAADGRHPNEQAYKILARWIAEEGGEATAPLRLVQIPQ